MALNIIIADDHPLFREALKMSVHQVFPGAHTIEADTVDSLLVALQSHPEVDVLLLDLNMPGAHGFTSLVLARASYPAVPVIVISGREDHDVAQRSLIHGAMAFVPKSAPVATLMDAVRTVVRGDAWTPANTGNNTMPRNTSLSVDEAEAAQRVAKLTPQQFRVLSMLCSGLSNKRIAGHLQVSEATVKAHMTAVLEKMGVANRTQAVLLAQRLALTQFTAPEPEERTSS